MFTIHQAEALELEEPSLSSRLLDGFSPGVRSRFIPSVKWQETHPREGEGRKNRRHSERAEAYPEKEKER